MLSLTWQQIWFSSEWFCLLAFMGAKIAQASQSKSLGWPPLPVWSRALPVNAFNDLENSIPTLSTRLTLVCAFCDDTYVRGRPRRPLDSELWRGETVWGPSTESKHGLEKNRLNIWQHWDHWKSQFESCRDTETKKASFSGFQNTKRRSQKVKKAKNKVTKRQD